MTRNVILALIVFTGCETCYSEQEIAVALNVGRLVPTEVYGLGHPSKKISESNNEYLLPLSLHSDQTSFIVKQTGAVDTITFSYTRKAFFQSNKCGVRVMIEGLSIGEPTTIENIDILDEYNFTYSKYHAFVRY